MFDCLGVMHRWKSFTILQHAECDLLIRNQVFDMTEDHLEWIHKVNQNMHNILIQFVLENAFLIYQIDLLMSWFFLSVGLNK